MPGLESRLSWYAQLYSRIGFVHEFRPLVAAEVKVALAGWRPPRLSLPADLLADVDGVAALLRATGGSFRLLDRLLSQVIVPGNPEDSALIKALKGLPPFDGSGFPRMPLGRPPVADPDIEFITQWIRDGCPDSDPAAKVVAHS